MLAYDPATKTVGGVKTMFDTETKTFVPLANTGNGVTGLQGFTATNSSPSSRRFEVHSRAVDRQATNLVTTRC